MELFETPIADQQYITQRVDAAFEQSGLDRLTLNELALPALTFAPASDMQLDIPTVSFGELDADQVTIVSTPVFTRLTPHFVLRLAAKHAVLGENSRVVGVEAYSPEALRHDKAALGRIATGSFAPLAERLFRAAEHQHISANARVTLEGPSLGGDIAAQAANDVLLNDARGIFNLQKVGVIDPARTANRSKLGVLLDFMKSGKQLGDQVVNSRVPALLEAWHVTGNQPAKEVEKVSTKDVMQYVRAGIGANNALLSGFATRETLEQLSAVITYDRRVQVLAARMVASTVFSEESFNEFAETHAAAYNLRMTVEPGNHASDDDIRRSAGFSLALQNL